MWDAFNSIDPGQLPVNRYLLWVTTVRYKILLKLFEYKYIYILIFCNFDVLIVGHRHIVDPAWFWCRGI